MPSVRVADYRLGTTCLGLLEEALVWVAEALVLVTPRTVVAWHQAGFRLYWKWLSQTGGRPPARREIRELIYCMAAENPT